MEELKRNKLLLNQALYDYETFKNNTPDHNRKSGLNIVKVSMRIIAYADSLNETFEKNKESMDVFVERLVKKYMNT